MIAATATQTQNARHRCGELSAISVVGGCAARRVVSADGAATGFETVESDIQPRLSPPQPPGAGVDGRGWAVRRAAPTDAVSLGG